MELLSSKSCNAGISSKCRQPSLLEAIGRRFLARFLSTYISNGCLTLQEAGGKNLTFEGNSNECSLKVDVTVNNPQFYWKVMTGAEIGLADAYANGDFSLVDENEGLYKLLMLLAVNRDADKSAQKLNKRRGWWTPLFFTAGIASATLFFQHALRRNSLTQARSNISHSYDLSNEVFALFLGETMQYSCGVFKTEDEDLNAAQMRKISLLIEKARIDQKHQVLEIGCGWGMLGIEIVKRTGCKYTGITLSKEQLKFAEIKVQEAGLQDHVTLKLCDYRQLDKTDKFDRIISCEMIEHVGHEYLEEFFGSCESLLEEDGLFVLQHSSVSDNVYDEHRRSTSFIKEYIFPGLCLASLSRITQAMSNASRLCVEHVENIAYHYGPTVRKWRKNFLANQSKILGMGFDQKFIRTYEFFFDYATVAFKSYTVKNYQVVFSRRANVKALGDPYKGFPSAYCSANQPYHPCKDQFV